MTLAEVSNLLSELRLLTDSRQYAAVVEVIRNNDVDLRTYPEVGVECVSALMFLRRDHEGVALASEIIESNPGLMDSTLMRRLHVIRANQLVRIGRVDEAARDVEVVLMGGYAPLDRLTANATNVIGTIHHYFGRWDEATGALQRAIAQHELLGLQRGRAAAHHNLGIVLCSKEAFADAEQHLLAAESYFLSQGTPIDHIICTVLRGLAVVGWGDVLRALPVAERGVALARQSQVRNLIGEALRVLGIVLTAAGRYSEANVALSEALLHADPNGYAHLRSEIAEAVGDLERQKGNEQAAVVNYCVARDGFRTMRSLGFVERVNRKLQRCDMTPASDHEANHVVT